MAFNDVAHIWLANGASVWVTYRSAPHGVGEDRGAQWIMAHPKPFDTFPTPSGTTQLESSRFQIADGGRGPRFIETRAALDPGGAPPDSYAADRLTGDL